MMVREVRTRIITGADAAELQSNLNAWLQGTDPIEEDPHGPEAQIIQILINKDGDDWFATVIFTE